MAVIPGKTCISCGKLTSNYAEFKCPKCGEAVLIRCYSCRQEHTRYKCTSCDFEGP